jgi:hypothetical protein
MRKYFYLLICTACLALVSTQARAEIIDPEKHVQRDGHHSLKMGDDGKTRFYSRTERVPPARIAALEADIARLPKHVEVQKMCDFMRGGAKAKLIEQRGIAFDVVLTNYGYSGPTVACVLKYIHEKNVGTQLIYSKKGAGGMYTVFVTD